MIEVYTTREAWLAARRRDPTAIGASEVAAVLGVSPHRGPWDVWTAKMAGDVADEPDVVLGEDDDAAPVDVEDPLVRGQVWEDHARRLVSLASGYTILPPAPEGVCLVRLDSDPWATSSPDGWLDLPERPTAELKTDASRSGWKWGRSGIDILDVIDDVPAPPHYLTQVWWQLATTGAPWGLLGAVLGSFRVRWFRVRENTDIQSSLLDRVGEWRERHLVRGLEPNPDASEAALAYARRLYLGRAGERAATPEEAAMIRDLHAARAAREEADTRARFLATRLLHAMSDCSNLTVGRARLTRDSRGALRVFGNP